MYSYHDFLQHTVIGKILQLSAKYSFDYCPTIGNITSGSSHNVYLDKGWDEYFFNNLFKKVENVDLGLDPINEAKTRFSQFVLEQNDYVKTLSPMLDLLLQGHNPELFQILEYTRVFLEKAFKDFKIMDINPRHSNGATLGCKKGSSILDKTKDSGGLLYLLEKADREHPFGVQLYWALQKLPTQGGNGDFYTKIDVVPKNAKIGRVIGVGSSTVVAVQNGFGDMISKILKKSCNIDMSTAQDLHKRIVLDASLGLEFSTLDLEGGSNNIWRALVYFLLRNRKDILWLFDTISPRTFTINDGESYHESEMLALQGNGFIMNFQTLFYYSLIHGLQQHLSVKEGYLPQSIYVFGDDIIVSRSIAAKVVNLFSFLRLKINIDKSFINPPFFESCGMDAIYGSNVRPYYVRNLPKTTLDWYRLANGVRRVCYYNNGYSWRSDACYDFWAWIVRSIPKEQRIYCPRIYGDAAINIEAAYLYKLGNPSRGDREYLRREKCGVKYPNKGLAVSGFPFSSETIRIKTTREINFENSFGTAVSGIKAENAIKLAIDPALKGTGLRLSNDGQESFYPYVFNSNGEKTQNQYVPYTPYGRSPSEDIEELFSFLKERGNEIITDTEHVLAVYNANLHAQRRKVISILRSLAQAKKQRIDAAKELHFEL